MLSTSSVFLSVSLLFGLKAAPTGEFFMTTALQDSKMTIESCLAMDECSTGLTERLQELRDKNVTAMPIRFTSSELPLGMDFRTQNLPQSPVTVNLSSLWWEGRDGVVAFDQAQSMELLTRIWGYQLGWTRSDIHDVASRLSWFTERRTFKTSSVENPYYSLVRFHDDSGKLFIEDARTSLQAVTLDADLAAFSCRQVNRAQGNLKDLKVTEISWVPDSFKSSPKVMGVTGKMTFTCGLQSFESEFQIRLPLIEGKTNQWHFDGTRVEKTHSVIRRISPNSPELSSLMF